MSAGEELQRLNMVEALPRLLSDGDTACIDKMVPKLQQALPGDGAEFHMIASHTFRTILEQKLVPPATFTQTFLSSIVACIDSHDPYTSKAWLETLLDIIDMLPANVVRNDVLPVAVARGQLSQSIQSRVTSCELLGKIATKFDSNQLQKDVVPLVHSLCQDVSGEVRGSICHQLPFIARGLSAEAVKPALLPLLVELAVDEEQYVRIAAIHTISNLVSVLPPDVLRHTIIPLLRKLCEQSISEENRVLCAISDKYGLLCVELKDAFSENEKSWFIGFFKEMASIDTGKQSSFHDIKNLAELMREREHADLMLQCRINCAYNFPGMAQFAGSSVFEEMLHPTFTNLACDHSFLVRRTVAGGFHEVFKVLGPRCMMIKSELLTLLSDESRDVLQALVPNLSAILEHLVRSGIIGPTITNGVCHEVLRSLLKCEQSLSQCNDWRLHSAMLEQLESFVKALPSDLIFGHLPVVLFRRMQDSRALPCRLASARLLLIVLRYTSKLENQNEIRNRIFTELCIHHSCHTRLLFVKMCGMTLDIFSSFYIKEHFFLRLLSLAGDPVPNIRLVLCGLLPRLRRLLKLPHDSSLYAAFQEAVERLKNCHRPDKDVTANLERACSDIESNVLNGQETHDAEDMARYQEEQHIEMRGSVSEPRRLVTVNMKKLGEGKRATLVSLRGPEMSRAELRQANRLNLGNDGNVSSSVAVSSIGLLGGYVGNESRITASITSTTSESSPSFNALSPLKRDSDGGFNSITHVGNDTLHSYRALTHNKKDEAPDFKSFAAKVKKESQTDTSKSWSQPLTQGSRLPLPVSTSSKSHKPQSKSSLSSSFPISDFDVTAVYMIISHFNSDSQMPSISLPGSSGSPSPSSSSSPSSLSSSYPALLEEEFYIDAGVPLPEKLTVAKMSTSSLTSSDTVSKIPSLRELLFQNSTLLAQVASRNTGSESTAKSLSYAKSFNSSKVVEETAPSSSLDSGANKRFSRIFEENASADFRYSSLVGRSSLGSRKENSASSLLPKPSSIRSFQNDGSIGVESSNISGPTEEGSQYHPKTLSVSSRATTGRKDSKIGLTNRRSLTYYSNHSLDSDASTEKERNVSASRNGRPESSIQAGSQLSSHEYDLGNGKLASSTANKVSNRLSMVPAGSSIRSSASRNSFGPSKVSSMKSHAIESQNRRYSSLDAPYSHTKEKDSAKNGTGQNSAKRLSVGEKTPITNGPLDKKVSLSSIGVKGIRRSYNPGPRPHSCLILTQQSDMANGTSSRSMSQESLGLDQHKVGIKVTKRSTSGFNRPENRQSRIPRGGTSCHSSPAHSRSTSPIHGQSGFITVSTAPCSARVSRASSPTDEQHPRVSLASIRLHEPSRLPIRKYNHHL